jgi:hypothetical protein
MWPKPAINETILWLGRWRTIDTVARKVAVYARLQDAYTRIHTGRYTAVEQSPITTWSHSRAPRWPLPYGR